MQDDGEGEVSEKTSLPKMVVVDKATKAAAMAEDKSLLVDTTQNFTEPDATLLPPQKSRGVLIVAIASLAGAGLIWLCVWYIQRVRKSGRNEMKK